MSDDMAPVVGDYDPPPPSCLLDRLLEKRTRKPAERVSFDAGHAFLGCSAEEAARLQHENLHRAPRVIGRR